MNIIMFYDIIIMMMIRSTGYTRTREKYNIITCTNALPTPNKESAFKCPPYTYICLLCILYLCVH